MTTQTREQQIAALRHALIAVTAPDQQKQRQAEVDMQTVIQGLPMGALTDLRVTLDLLQEALADERRVRA